MCTVLHVLRPMCLTGSCGGARPVTCLRQSSSRPFASSMASSSVQTTSGNSCATLGRRFRPFSAHRTCHPNTPIPWRLSQAPLSHLTSLYYSLYTFRFLILAYLADVSQVEQRVSDRRLPGPVLRLCPPTPHEHQREHPPLQVRLPHPHTQPHRPLMTRRLRQASCLKRIRVTSIIFRARDG